MKNWNFEEVKNQATQEAYAYFDKNIRALPKDAKLGDNDVDAFRHAYVSGVFTQDYGATVANFCGIMQEIFRSGNNTPAKLATSASTNMDYWNNNIGRKYGKKTSSRSELVKKLQEALTNGELIIDLKDTRKYIGKAHFSFDKQKPVVVLRESPTGRNELFVDLIAGKIMTREDFVQQIKSNNYLGYFIVPINGIDTPVSKPDKYLSNNLK
ncbi:hypothetical protein NO2_0635 [Candidatus Termititenax persephonae]|uniref:DUF6973 domain-containing protein n=1 Tax=Candidatus Termititenax persephonae TaxID=2218525 RepID=A0A388TGT9_9BACT|nr:hypothetical protein NO2_0635 [Candidatus Termititenax persephonae]